MEGDCGVRGHRVGHHLKCRTAYAQRLPTLFAAGKQRELPHDRCAQPLRTTVLMGDCPCGELA